ncbi:hypothetical protein L1049_015947 [Liquidambar formosana]|uniref:ResB-like domain-containing protein n=1 Tax=Liquidambar formosana TaxID=63359 RepID=A0AAP0RYL3_LIQFO
MLARDLQSIVLYDPEGKFAGVRRPNSKLPIEIDGTKIVIEDAIGSSGLDLKTDPGVPIVYAGFGALMLTTCISYLSHAQIWAFQDGTTVIVGGKTNRAKGEFPEEMDRLLNRIGMGGALETLCGQAVGARQLNMLGIYMQRSLIITGITACFLIPLYVFTSPLQSSFIKKKIFRSLLMLYVISGCHPDAWTGFSVSAFRSLSSFLKLLLASAIMLCLELWYYSAVIILVGWLKNPEIAVDSTSICVRVSNELGAGHPKAAKFSVVAAVITSTLFGTLFAAVILATKRNFPKIFSKDPQVIRETLNLGYFLAATIFLGSIQPVLHGVAVGAGWQLLVALINTGCYCIFGLPLGALLGYKFNLGIRGI